MLDDLRMFGRYAFGLRSFLRRPLTSAECRRMIMTQLGNREESFLRILERGVFANPRSPYRKLLSHAGAEFGDLVQSVRRKGIEATLEKLHDQGVYVTFDEFKGRRPIQRSGLSLSVLPEDFDNPLLARHYESRTGGSRGAGTRIIIDFDLLTHEAAYCSLFLTAFHMANRPGGIWHPVPPGVAGMKHVLRYAKLGKPVERWFSQNRLAFRPGTAKYFAFTSYAIYGSRLIGRPLPVPEYVPLEKASQVALWLATKKEEGTSAMLDTNPSSAVRVCLAAKGQGLDISGTFFRLTAEPYTPAKAQVVNNTGCQAVSLYSMAEIGNIGIACASPASLDDVHLLKDKVAIIQQEKPKGNGGFTVGALFYTTVLPSCPVLMLNVESGDYAALEERKCGCLFEELGFHHHLHTIRSYDKLTSEGMTFLGSDLTALIEEVLPARFGGHPTDYQFVEEEVGGLPKVTVVVSRRLGMVDEGELVATVLNFLQSYPGVKKMMAERWRDANTLKVIRREPYATGAAKILPLHILGRRNSHARGPAR